MKITGELLKSERIKLKLSPQDVGFALKLSAKTITALEEGDVSALPAKTFIRGFVKSYAQFLKLDSELVIRQYQEEMGTTRPIPKAAPVQAEPVRNQNYKIEDAVTKKPEISTVTPNLKTGINKNTMITIAIIAVAVIAVGGINHVINKYKKEGAAANPEKMSVESINQEVTVEKALATSADVTPAVPDKKSTTPPANPATQLPPNQTPTNAPATPSGTAPAGGTTRPAASSTATQPTATASAVAAPDSVSGTKPTTVDPANLAQKPSKEQPIELVIEALKDTVISYSVGTENNFKSIQLKKDTFQIIKSKTGLYLRAEEGNSVSLTVNGVNKGVASSEAKPIQLSF